MFGLGYNRFHWTPVSFLAAAIFGVFIAQSIETVWLHSSVIADFGALSINGLRHGEIWQLLTYALLHGGFWHAVLNILALVLIGIPLQAEIGNRAFAMILLLMALAGGLAFSLSHVGGGGALMGASAIAVGLITLYCLVHPERPLTVLLFFVLPITLMPRWILYFTLAVNLVGFCFNEIAPGAQIAGIGYSAHLGGMLAAWVISRWCLKSYSKDGGPSWRGQTVSQPPVKKRSLTMPGWLTKKLFRNPKGLPDDKPSYEVNSSRATLQKELDRILDKINTKGFGELTSEEKETLHKAKDILGK